PSYQQETLLTTSELQRLEANWRMMDAMITNAVKQYAAATGQQELRDILLDILLDARYRLKDALMMPVSRADDPVRHWFIQSWQRLGPVLRQISLERPGQEPMLIVSLVTANNALRALDRLGPAIGLEVSADGLRRMGRLLINPPGVDPLRYDEAIDPELRRLFELPAASGTAEPTGFYFDLWPIRCAWAKRSGDRLNLWVPQKNELPTYLSEMRELLVDNAEQIAREKNLKPSMVELYRRTVLTTAWQESCWRQYVVEKKKIVPLRSNTGDSGLMQLNERVWRGLYDLQKLRWDIAYNARAGAEILSLYLLRYALKRGEQKHPGGLDNLARATYSAYNGGPGQTSRYRNPTAAPSLKKIDAAFWKKYQAVKQGGEMQVAECLGGDAKHIRAKPRIDKPEKQRSQATDKQQPSAAKTAKSVGRAWVLAQHEDHYTLQLAVFSSMKAVHKFRDENNLPGIVAVAPVVKNQQVQFVVLNGSFKTRSAADRQKLRYTRLKPWVRQFSDIRASIQR
nr:transglycosylase SLT domain-containing protein [Gammaproteobacteria bacterium]